MNLKTSIYLKPLCLMTRPLFDTGDCLGDRHLLKTRCLNDSKERLTKFYGNYNLLDLLFIMVHTKHINVNNHAK